MSAYHRGGQSALSYNRMEFIDDRSVSELLMNTAVSWFREEGMEFVHGPLGFTNLDTQGLLIEGFEFLPSIASVYHRDYYKDHFEAMGWPETKVTMRFWVIGAVCGFLGLLLALAGGNI